VLCGWLGAELVIIDPPMMKIPNCEWDAKLFDHDEWRSILQDLRHLSGGIGWAIAIYLMPEMYSLIFNVLKECAFVGITPFYWIKTDTNHNGAPSQFLNAVQMLVVASSSSEHLKLQKGFPVNPHHRLNSRFAHGVRTPYKHSRTGQVLNPTEKPGEIAEFFCNMYLRGLRTQRAIVLGSGAGGDVMGVLRAGYNVIYIDSDKDQQEQLAQRIRVKQQTMEHQKTTGELEPDVMGLVTTEDYDRVSKLWLQPFCPRMAAAAELEVQPTVKQIREDLAAEAREPAAGPACVACGVTQGLAKCTGCGRMLCSCKGEDTGTRACGKCPATKPAVPEPPDGEQQVEEGKDQ
jgi:hypothetical protein